VLVQSGFASPPRPSDVGENASNVLAYVDGEDQFGFAMAATSNRCVVGAPREDSATANNASPNSGAAYAFC
jgi:hypothetical protein